MNRPKSSLALCLACALWLAGCATTPLSKYPSFPQRKPQIANVHLVTDVSVVQDILGETNRVDLDESKEMAALFSRRFVDGLKSKGYRVTDRVLLSVGAGLDPTLSYKVREKDGDKRLAASQLPRRNPPIYLDESFAQSESASSDLLSLCWALQAHQGAKGGSTIPTEFRFLKHEPGDAVAVLAVRGSFVPVAKQLGEVLVTRLLTGGLLSVWQISALRCSVFIVDPSNGEVLWADSTYEEGEALRATRKTVLERMANRMLRTLP